jgi:hypothetical protein
MTDIQKEKAVGQKGLIKTKRIDNWIPHIEVIPKRIMKKEGIQIPQMTDPYQGEIGLVVSTNCSYTGELVLYCKHMKKRLVVFDSEKLFIPETEVLCAIELSDDLMALDYISQHIIDDYERQADNADGPQYEDRRMKRFIPVGF